MAKDKQQQQVEQPQTLQAVITNLRKQHGKGIISDNSSHLNVEYISSGSIALDIALSGGYGRGRIIEVFGLESSGKTTLALHAVAEAQKMGLTCVYIDMEHGLNGSWASLIGVNLEKLVLSQPSSAEQALNTAETFIRSGQVGLIIIDSVASLIPEAEVEGQIGDQLIGLQARIMSQAMRKFASITHQTNTSVIFLNQIRLKAGIVYGNPEVTSGGLGLKFYASQRLEARRKAVLGPEDNKYGITTKVKVVKNKIGWPFREAEIDIIFNKGIDSGTDLVRTAASVGVVKKAGAWYSYQDKQLGQGEAAAALYLSEQKELLKEVRDKTLEAGRHGKV